VAVHEKLAEGRLKNRLAAGGDLERMTKSELVAAARQLSLSVKTSESKEVLVGLLQKVIPNPNSNPNPNTNSHTKP
jgi:hypothetical protein